MFTLSQNPKPLGARIYAAKIDMGCDLSGEWIMVANPHTERATFYAVRSESLFHAQDHAFGNPARYSTPRFVVHFSDLLDGLDDDDDQGSTICFRQFREDLTGQRHVVGEIVIERERLIDLIRTVGLLALKHDEEWTERVVLVSPDEEERDGSGSEAEEVAEMGFRASPLEHMADSAVSRFADMHITTY